MITRLVVIIAIGGACALELLAQQPELFQVSLAAPRYVDLSPIYQQAVHEAIASYRGDFPPGQFFMGRSRSFTVYFDSSGRRIEMIEPSPEIIRPLDPFPQQPFQLRQRPEELPPRL